MTLTFYYVCDRCGTLAHITDFPIPDDGSYVCECGSDALWQFTSAHKAMQYSADVLDRNRNVTPNGERL